jgi:hypothetical protein
MHGHCSAKTAGRVRPCRPRRQRLQAVAPGRRARYCGRSAPGTVRSRSRSHSLPERGTSGAPEDPAGNKDRRSRPHRQVVARLVGKGAVPTGKGHSDGSGRPSPTVHVPPDGRSASTTGSGGADGVLPGCAGQRRDGRPGGHRPGGQQGVQLLGGPACGRRLRRLDLRLPQAGDSAGEGGELAGQGLQLPQLGRQRCAERGQRGGGCRTGTPPGGSRSGARREPAFLPRQPEPVDTVPCTVLRPRPGRPGRTSVPRVGLPRCVLGGVPAAVQLGQGQVGGELAAAEPDRRAGLVAGRAGRRRSR